MPSNTRVKNMVSMILSSRRGALPKRNQAPDDF
jgi:hypothetical protein